MTVDVTGSWPTELPTRRKLLQSVPKRTEEANSFSLLIT